MSIDPEFDPFMEQIPPSSRLGVEIELHASRHIVDLQTEFRETYGYDFEDLPNSISNADVSVQPFKFMAADAVRLMQIDPRQTLHGSSANMIVLRLYANGEELVFEEDKGVINNVSGQPTSTNMYVIACFPESPPIVINENELERIENKVRKSKLEVGLEYPLSVPTIEDYLSCLLEEGRTPRYLSETQSQQAIDMLRSLIFKPDFDSFDELTG